MLGIEMTAKLYSETVDYAEIIYMRLKSLK